MKKVLIAIGVILLLQGEAWCLTATQEADVRVEVESIFTISIDQGFINFERMKPGEVKWNIPYTALTTTCKSNRGNPWYIKVSTNGDLLSGDALIPNQNFYWYGWTLGRGTWYGTKENQLTITPVLAYAASADEYFNYPNGTQNAFKFKLKIPENARPGIYSTSVKFTMTE